nr:putative ribonuclease H-like domain-containing protein [Tanacetum cinerariifolium]
MSAMGELNFFFGLQVLQKEDGIFLSQDKYVGDILKKFGYTDVRNTKIYIDNNNAICIVKNPVYHSKTKHIEIRHHFIRDCFEKKLISVDNIPTNENVADLLTKPFDVGRFQSLVVEHDMRGFVKGNIIIYTLFVSHIVLGWVIRTSKFWGVLRILMISLTLIPLGEFNIDFHPMVDFIEASPLSPKSTGFNEFSYNIATPLVCLATNRTYNFSKMIFNGLVKNVNNKISKFLMYPRFLSMYLRMSQFGQITYTQMYVGEGSGTPTEPHHTPSLEAQPPSHTAHSSSSLPPVTTTSILTVTPSDTTPIRQYTKRTRIAQSSDRATINKSSTLPHDSAPRVTSPAAIEGSMQQTFPKLMALCTSLQRQLFELTDKFQAQEVEINRLKERVKLLEERKGAAAIKSKDDALIKGRSMDEGEASTERVSDDTKEMATVLTSTDAATVLASGVVDVPTGNGSIPTASTPAKGSVPTGSEEVPTASLVFATATVIDAQVARELEEQLEREDQRRAEQIARDAEIARIHTEEELQSMIDGLDRNNETMEDFIPMGSKEEAKMIRRKGINLEQESAKKQNTSEEVTEEAKSPKEVPEEKVKEMMQLVPIEEVYVEALQVKHPINDWKVYHEG